MQILVRVLECKYGPTDPSTSVSGTKEKLAVTEGSYWLMATHMKANGLRTKPMAVEPTCTQMAHVMKDSG